MVMDRTNYVCKTGGGSFAAVNKMRETVALMERLSFLMDGIHHHGIDCNIVTHG